MGFMRKADFELYRDADKHYNQVLTTRDFLALGVGTIISTSIFTLPGQVAAQFAGPGVVFSYLLAALVAGFVALAYAEMSTVMPFAGSAYSWISVLFGEGFGWIAGWALLAEYFIAVAFVGSGFSANLQQLLAPLGFHLPKVLANPFGTDGGVVDIISLLVILLSAIIVFRGASDAGRISQILVVLKVAAVIAFIIVGITVIKPANYHPFIPPHNPKTGFGGFSGIWSGVSMIFLAYIGFDSIAANSAEAKNPKNNATWNYWVASNCCCSICSSNLGTCRDASLLSLCRKCSASWLGSSTIRLFCFIRSCNSYCTCRNVYRPFGNGSCRFTFALCFWTRWTFT